jgi:hypothetical protein
MPPCLHSAGLARSAMSTRWDVVAQLLHLAHSWATLSPHWGGTLPEKGGLMDLSWYRGWCVLISVGSGSKPK